MRVHSWLVLVSVVLLASVSEGAPEPIVDDTHRLDITTRTPVAVHVYSQVADLGEDEKRIALDVAREVFSAALVDIAWTLCEPGMCLTPSAETLKIRIALSPHRGDAESGVLGQALIDSQARAGVLATVFIDRIQRLAGTLGIDHRILLGRAIAHELGHLILGTASHGTGLMREVWSQKELVGTAHDDWALDPLDAFAIRRRLAGRGQRGG